MGRGKVSCIKGKECMRNFTYSNGGELVPFLRLVDFGIGVILDRWSMIGVCSNVVIDATAEYALAVS